MPSWWHSAGKAQWLTCK